MTIRPMRGAKPTKPLDQFPFLVSAKIDGLRAIVKDGTVYSKTMLPIPNQQIQERFGHLHGLDGELTVGLAYATGPEDDVFDRSRGPIMRKDCEADFRFNVFDLWNEPSTPAYVRIDKLHAFSKEPGVEIVHHFIAHCETAVEMLHDQMVAQGYEGCMLRQHEAPYKWGQSTEREAHLLKIKRFTTAEAIILDVIEQQANTNEAKKDELGRTKRSSAKAGKVGKGTFGAFLVRDLVTNVEFTVGMGPGLTDLLRDNLWQRREELPGQIITYRYQACGTKAAPRLPAFLRFRDAIDTDEAPQ